MKITCIVLILILLFLGCWKSLEPITINGAVIGQWQETFQTHYIQPIKIPEDTTDIVVERLTTLEFTETRFKVETLPHVPNVLGAYDGLYTGTYQIKLDTIVFNIADLNLKRRVIYHLKGEDLFIEIPSYPINDSLFTIELGSFIWGGSMNKTTGIFRRTKEK